MIGNRHFDELIANAPVNLQRITPDWAGVASAMQADEIDPSAVLAVSWCDLSTSNIEANVDPTILAIIHGKGVLATAGKKKMMGGGRIKYQTIPFSSCRTYGETEYVDDRGYGKFCIDFCGAGSVLLGRLEWDYKLKRFRNTQAETIAVAQERDRVLEVVSPLI